MGALIRLILVVVVLAAIAAFFLGYRVQNGAIVGPDGTPATSGRMPQVDTEKAREAGAAIGDKVAVGANAAQHAIANATLTGKIKAKITLDDTLKGSTINVDSADGVVTLTGTVRSQAQQARALQLAREAEGVKSVNDRLAVR
ncbi:MAG: BON domain-containing protein [Acidobacteriota bacterium]|nr:BON domain-containing protein [Acidobacteriota bacterium]